LPIAGKTASSPWLSTPPNDRVSAAFVRGAEMQSGVDLQAV
jgi:hypothetical protein